MADSLHRVPVNRTALSPPTPEDIAAVIQSRSTTGLTGLGVLYGPSRSGKTKVLKELVRLGVYTQYTAEQGDDSDDSEEDIWGGDSTAVVSSIAQELQRSDSRGAGGEAAKDATKRALQRLMCMGLRSVPSWLRPFSKLSTGEKERARLARGLRDGCCVDDLGAHIDAQVRYH